jgi:diguanylate cyclase (GGDEF)-like protein
MKGAKPINPFTPLEIRNFITPISLAAILIFVGMTIEAFNKPSPVTLNLLGFGIVGVLYIVFWNILIVRFNNLRISYEIINSLSTGFALGYLSLKLPQPITEINHVLIILGAVAIATLSGRKFVYLFLLGMVSISLPNKISTLTNIESTLGFLMPIAVCAVVPEVIIRLKDTAKQHIYRLETINKVSRQIMQSLDTKKTLSLLDATIQETLAADTFFIGILEQDEINLELFFDDGTYFNGTHVPVTGTLSGWVIKNQKELFLPDLRVDVQLEGVERFVIGKEKTSLSWIGVPLKAQNITGVLALASYTANAFDRADLELLINLGQHVTLALDNTIRHAQVERQARLDSLTGVYNHGYFLKRLAEQAKQSSDTDSTLSLIMLDIDYFKEYNDSFGHLVGDRVLQSLCSAIQHHIKQTDSIGRWGGEEFVISLPGADGRQAFQIAKRISETLGVLRVDDNDQRAVPIPTLSQGIAVFPLEANEIYRLIDIADKRLYIAKERGRNQIEPNTDI